MDLDMDITQTKVYNDDVILQTNYGQTNNRIAQINIKLKPKSQKYSNQKMLYYYRSFHLSDWYKQSNYAP